MIVIPDYRQHRTWPPRRSTAVRFNAVVRIRRTLSEEPPTVGDGHVPKINAALAEQAGERWGQSLDRCVGQQS
jgi:hypothetical protein